MMFSPASPAVYATPSISLKDLKNALAPMAANWRELGVQFDFTEGDLDGIQGSHSSGGVSQWLSSMLDAKINNCPGFSWGDVVSALETLGRHTLAEHIRNTFITLPTTSTGSSSALSELIKENDVRLREEFADLLVQACRHFETLVKPEVFRTYARSLFAPAPFISTAVSIRDMVDAITDYGRWNYLRYRSLLRVVKRFDRNGELEERCRKYEQSVAQFIFTARIKDWIVRRNIANNTPQQSKLVPAEYSKLSTKVEINVTDETLSYVIELWDDIANRLFQLPHLDAVLHDIKEGCILVTWLIPNSDELKNHIRENAPLCSSFFEQHRIQYCLLDDEFLYKLHDYQGIKDGGSETSHPATTDKSLLPVSSSDSHLSVSERTPLKQRSSRSLPSRTSSLRTRRTARVKVAYRSVNADFVEEDSSAKCCCCIIL